MRKIFTVYISFLLLSSLFFSCKTIKESDYYRDTASHSPFMHDIEGVANIDSLSNVIPYGGVNVSGYQIKKYEKPEDHKYSSGSKDNIKNGYFRNNEIYYTKDGFIPDIRIFDIIKAFSNEVNSINLTTDSSVKGTIEMKILKFEKRKNLGFFFANAFFAFIPSFLGVPITKYTTNIKVQIIVKALNNKEIKTYTANGVGENYVAMYWGYGKDIGRKSALTAFANAMESIVGEMEKDEEYLNSAIYNTNTKKKQGSIKITE